MIRLPAAARLQDAFFPRFGVAQDVLEAVVDRCDDRWREYLLDDRPPAELADAHDDHLFARLWRRVLGTVRDPVQVAWVGEHRWVQVLDTAVFLTHPDGEIHGHAWACDRLGRHELEMMDERTVVAQGMPWRNLWLERLAEFAALEVLALAETRGVEMAPTIAQAWSTWAFAVFARRLRRCADLRTMRRRIAAALRFDPWALRVAGRLPRTRMPAEVVTLAAYNRVVRHRAAFESLQAEAPALVPVFGAVCDAQEFPEQGQPVERLKRYLRSEGLGERTWRLVAHADARLLRPLGRFYTGDLAEVAVEHLRLLDRLQLRRQPPAWFIDQLIGAWGDPGNRWGTYVDQIDRPADLWRHVARAAPLSATPTQALCDELDLVQRWIAVEGPAIALDKRQRRAGWAWLTRRARQWDAEHRARLELDPRPWPAPFEREALGDWELVVLCNELDLWEEARAMRHCVYVYGPRCRQGGRVLASLRRGGRRVATVDFQHGPEGWHVVQTQGFANSEVGEAARAAVASFVGRLSKFEPPPPTEVDTESRVLDDEAAIDFVAAYEEPEDVEDDQDEWTEVVEARLLDEVVAVALDDVEPAHPQALHERLDQWLQHRFDEGDLSYTHGGPILFNQQLQDWENDVDGWIDRLRGQGEIDDTRHARLQRSRTPVKQLSADERGWIQAAFTELILSGEDVDADRYAQWGAEPVTDTAGRSAWVVYTVTGYSFTSVELQLHGVCHSLQAVRDMLLELGPFSGGPPIDGSCEATIEPKDTERREK